MDQVGAGVVSGLLSKLGLPSSLLSPLVAHAEAVSDSSPRLGLVSTGDEQVILRRHTADSLVFALARPPAQGERWADLGSGGGFPGIPLAICYPSAEFALIESNTKKSGFLEMLSLDLGLSNVSVIAGRAEDHAGTYDVAVSRAVARPNQAMQQLFPLVRGDGECIVAAAEPVSGARVFRADLPDVDSPGCLSMMTSGGRA